MKRVASHIAIGLLSAVLGGAFALRFLASIPPEQHGADRYVHDSIPGWAVVEYISNTGFSPAAHYRYVEFGRRRRVPVDAGILSLFLEEKYRSRPIGDEDFIRELIHLHNLWPTTVLNRWEDIPGFVPGTLDPDLSPIPDPFTPIGTGKQRHYIVCTIGGIVRRYRLVGPPGLRCLAEGVLMTQVGDSSGLL